MPVERRRGGRVRVAISRLVAACWADWLGRGDRRLGRGTMRATDLGESDAAFVDGRGRARGHAIARIACRGDPGRLAAPRPRVARKGNTPTTTSVRMRGDGA